MSSPDTAITALPRPAEKVAIVSFILVFLCGAVLGAVVMSVSFHGVRTTHAATPAYSMSVQDWRRELNLTDEQTVELTSILDDFSHYYDNVLADGNSRIMQILNPAQRQKFQQLVHSRKP